MKNALAFCLLMSLLVGGIYSCGKDKFTTIPQIDIKDISPEIVSQGSIIQFRSEFRDDEGDVDSVLLVTKYFNNETVTFVDTLYYPFDNYGLPPKTRTAEIIVEYIYASASPPGTRYAVFPYNINRDTTAAFGIVLLDKEKHRSEYKESSKIRLIRP